MHSTIEAAAAVYVRADDLLVQRVGGRPSAIGVGSQHLPEGLPRAQGDRHTSPDMDRCAKGEGGVWVKPGGGDRRYTKVATTGTEVEESMVMPTRCSSCIRYSNSEDQT